MRPDEARLHADQSPHFRTPFTGACQIAHTLVTEKCHNGHDQ